MSNAKPFMDDDFLLESDTAKELFHNHAESLPIIDYHCHLNPREIAEDHRFSSITELWLGGDHYKWRAERTNGVDERFITGDAGDWEKFEKWAETVPYLFRNPLYHWTHLELKTAFGITEPLNPKSARKIYDECNAMLKTPEFSARSLMKRYEVETVCTTDDPADSLIWHQRIRKSGFEVKVLPAWRPDKALDVDNPAEFREYVEKLGKVCGKNILTYGELIDSLQARHDFFASQGCLLADHGIAGFPFAPATSDQIDNIFLKAMAGKVPDRRETEQFKTETLLNLARMNAAKNWAQQFHYGPMRNNNTKMFRSIGKDTGFDSMLGTGDALKMSRFLDVLNNEGMLAKTIIYNLNPADNAMVASMAGNFQDGSVPGKIQFGAAWWFNDHINGMTDQINALSALGLLSRFVGMLTDSRSFVSYPRHEYFRRILCNILGDDVEKGLIPASEMQRVGQMVEDISYYNAKNYFNF